MHSDSLPGRASSFPVYEDSNVWISDCDDHCQHIGDHVNDLPLHGIERTLQDSRSSGTYVQSAPSPA